MIMVGLAGTVLLAACSRHGDDDLVAIPVLVLAPAPDSVVVTTISATEFDLTWFVSDPSNVLFYRVYGSDFFGNLFFADSTAQNSATAVGVLVPIFGVSSVSTDYVESSVTLGVATIP